MPAGPICGQDYDSELAYCPACRGEKQAEAAPGTAAEGDGDMDALRREVQALAAAGEKIAAIKLYRERTGVGLAEAKSAVEGLGRPAPAADGELERQVLTLLQDGKKIEAIRVYREQTRSGLKEAKEAVEALGAKHGIAAKGVGCAGMLLIAIALAATIASLG